MTAVERTVRIGLMTYTDPDGAVRRALTGAVVQVHPDHAARFDRYNLLPGEQPPEPEAQKPAPPKRGRTRKES